MILAGIISNLVAYCELIFSTQNDFNISLFIDSIIVTLTLIRALVHVGVQIYPQNESRWEQKKLLGQEKNPFPTIVYALISSSVLVTINLKSLRIQLIVWVFT
jgi:hypothetical protein